MTRAGGIAKSCLLAAVLGAAGSAGHAAQVAYDEAVRGDVTGQSGGGPLLALGVGSTAVTGTLWVRRDAQGTWLFDADRFRFALAAGLHLDAIDVAYAFDASDVGARGGTVRHTLRWDDSPASVFTQDIDSASSAGVQALFDDTGRLPPAAGGSTGEFSIGWPYLAAFRGDTLGYRYTVTFEVGGNPAVAPAPGVAAVAPGAEVPEPPALAVAALALAAAAMRRRSARPR